MDLDMAQLRAFVAVVDHRHFGRAARSLSLSQQTLSKRVARLEAALGSLVERRRGGVGLTTAGEQRTERRVESRRGAGVEAWPVRLDADLDERICRRELQPLDADRVQLLGVVRECERA